MNIKHTIVSDFEIKELASALASSTPEEFASFWFKFSEITEKIDLRPFGEAMAPSFGANRKNALIKLYELMKYFELQEKFS